MKNKIEKYQKGKTAVYDDEKFNDPNIEAPVRTNTPISNNGVRGLLGTTNFQVRKFDFKPTYPSLQFDESGTTQPVNTQLETPQARYGNPTSVGGLYGLAFQNYNDVLGGSGSQYGTPGSKTKEELEDEEDDKLLTKLAKAREEAAKTTTTPAAQTPAKKTVVPKSKVTAQTQADKDFWKKNAEANTQRLNQQIVDKNKPKEPFSYDLVSGKNIDKVSGKSDNKTTVVKKENTEKEDTNYTGLLTGAGALAAAGASYLAGNALMKGLGKLQKYNPVGRISALIPGINYKGKSNKKPTTQNTTTQTQNKTTVQTTPPVNQTTNSTNTTVTNDNPFIAANPISPTNVPKDMSGKEGASVNIKEVREKVEEAKKEAEKEVTKSKGVPNSKYISTAIKNNKNIGKINTSRKSKSSGTVMQNGKRIKEDGGLLFQKGGYLNKAKQFGKEALTDTAIGSVLDSKKSERDFDWIDGISLGASFVPGLNAVSAGFDASRNLYDEYKAGDLDSKDFVREGLDFTTNLIPGAKAAKKAYKFTRAIANPKTAKAIGGATKLIFTNEKGGQLFKDGGLVGKKFKKPLMVFQD